MPRGGKIQHGMAMSGSGRVSPEWTAYYAAKKRCTNPNMPNWRSYGGRGIKFLFENFEQFLLVLGKRPSPEHSLDRIDNGGHYEPSNVRWATKREQFLNQRPSLTDAPQLFTEA